MVDSISLSDDELDQEVHAGCDRQRSLEDDFGWSFNDDLRISENQLLINKHLDRASLLLKNQFPNLKGLQNTIYGQESEKFESRFRSLNGDGMQFHNDGDNHWLLSASAGKEVYLFDSLKAKPTKNLQSQLFKVYKECVQSGKMKIKYQNVCCQEGYSDCGLFAIAFATDIAHGNNPEKIDYHQQKMRTHLLECFKSNFMSPFPRSSSLCQRKGEHYVEIHL